jgi:phosphoribosylanthranilate isomerase
LYEIWQRRFWHELKICGIRTLRDADCVNRAGVDCAGFVFPPHRRRIGLETARRKTGKIVKR